MKQQTNSERVVSKWGPLVWRICYVRLAPHDRAAVDDAYQNVFLTYIEKPPLAEPDSDSERAWFVKCAVNRCNDVLRARSRRAECELDELIPSPDELHNDALDALMRLPDRYRLPMYLHYVVGYDTAECARMLGLTGSGVRMRLSRGRRLFAELYGEEDDESDCDNTLCERKPI